MSKQKSETIYKLTDFQYAFDVCGASSWVTLAPAIA